MITLAGPDEKALIQSLVQLRGEASARPPHATLRSYGWGASQWRGDPPLRAAIVASSCEKVADRAKHLERRLLQPARTLPVLGPGVVAARRDEIASVGLLFPGQGSPAKAQLGAIGRHVPSASALHRGIGLPQSEVPKELTQLAIVASSLAALHALDRLGVKADFCIGHSLGELLALHWAGAYDRETLVKMTRLRGNMMTRDSIPDGAMAAVLADGREMAQLLAHEEAVIACFNTPRQHVVSGRRGAIDAICVRAHERRIAARRLEVTGAFHSPLMAPVARAFAEKIAAFEIGAARRPVASTVSGSWLGPGDDLRSLLVRQIDSPVLFWQAVELAAGADLLIEAGSGKVLSRLVRELTDALVVVLPADGGEADFWQGVAALWACGVAQAADDSRWVM